MKAIADLITIIINRLYQEKFSFLKTDSHFQSESLLTA
jgi:hypothetical protein